MTPSAVQGRESIDQLSLVSAGTFPTVRGFFRPLSGFPDCYLKNDQNIDSIEIPHIDVL